MEVVIEEGVVIEIEAEIEIEVEEEMETEEEETVTDLQEMKEEEIAKMKKNIEQLYPDCRRARRRET